MKKKKFLKHSLIVIGTIVVTTAIVVPITIAIITNNANKISNTNNYEVSVSKVYLFSNNDEILFKNNDLNLPWSVAANKQENFVTLDLKINKLGFSISNNNYESIISNSLVLDMVLSYKINQTIQLLPISFNLNNKDININNKNNISITNLDIKITLEIINNKLSKPKIHYINYIIS